GLLNIIQFSPCFTQHPFVMFHTTSLRSRGAFLRPGFDFLASLTRMRGGPSTERRTGCFCRHPVGVLSGARQALVRRLASLVRETHASRRSTVAILGSGPALPSPAFAPGPASSSQPGPSAWRAGSRASRGKRLPAARRGTPLLARLQVVSAEDTPQERGWTCT